VYQKQENSQHRHEYSNFSDQLEKPEPAASKANSHPYHKQYEETKRNFIDAKSLTDIPERFNWTRERFNQGTQF
jgi:hypothetical protein